MYAAGVGKACASETFGYETFGFVDADSDRKKTLAFMTNNNPNTKENIANVFGAKTLLGLIPLDVRFELEPSNRPAATQSPRIPDEGEAEISRAVRIVGHISRPVVGEGRQTPDRQMFFVNSRPCNLPQVAKAINEVYKSYNITQSPFVFADLQIDTNAYDVNVSPDKRTIMLHDQANLLEGLKEKLAEMFEGHEQRVPQSQMVGRTAVTAFRLPAMRQRESTEKSLVEDGGAADRLRRMTSVGSMSSDRDVEEEQPSRPGFVKASLIERFAERGVGERGEYKPVKRNVAVNDKTPSEFEETELGQDAQESGLDLDEPMADLVTSTMDQDKDDPNPRNHAQAETHRKTSSTMQAESTEAIETADSSGSSEETIPAIEHTSRGPLTQSTIHNAFDRMRPPRTPAQHATITIGDTTTTTIIGNGIESRAAKRARIHTPKSRDRGTASKTQSLFNRTLKGYVAPGMQIGDESTLR